jgi:rhodanese-related sulfurtransferase
MGGIMPHQTADPAAVHALLADPETVYVDVRTEEEFAQGHVPGSYNIPILFSTAFGMQPNPKFIDAVTRHFPAKAKQIVFGCKSGGRSERACELIAEQGYSKLVNMAGGFHGAFDMSGNVVEQGWAACGFDTQKKAEAGRTWKELKD